jgi:hypothetical protein
MFRFSKHDRSLALCELSVGIRIVASAFAECCSPHTILYLGDVLKTKIKQNKTTNTHGLNRVT